jgi:hypothetical protein
MKHGDCMTTAAWGIAWAFATIVVSALVIIAVLLRG